MARCKITFVIICSISLCLCEIDIRKKAKLVNGFVDFYNRLPSEIYTCDEGFLQNAQLTDISNAYDIEVSLKVSETHNPDTNKYLKCTARIADLDDGVAVMRHQCQDDLNPAGNPVNIEEEMVTEANVVTEAEFVRKPIQLDNEVQTDTAVTSGEQFIAIPREEPKVHCIGCSSHVNPQAPGVSELADVGVRQLNSLEPNVQHTVTSVVEVERQVQVINGVRYILTVLMDFNSCPHQQTDPCSISKACKITILEKPWMLLPDGSKYRAILSNNCTKEWRFGDDGVVPPSDNKENNNISPTNPDGSGIIKVHNVDVQSPQKTERTMTDQDLKNIEEQIIPQIQFTTQSPADGSALKAPLTPDLSKDHVAKVELENQHSPNLIQTTKLQKVETLDDDKKKTIDELLNYFNLAGFDVNTNIDQTGTRVKRSFENDLNAINIAEKFQKLKKNIENAKHIYTLAQSVVDYLNEMDLEVKHRVLKDVITAEMESESKNKFYYIQFRTIVPCKLRVCKPKDTVTKICNAVVDNTEKTPQILNVFCHDEDSKNYVGKMNSIPSDDPVLHQLVEESLKKIETESMTSKAIKLNKIIDATTQRVSGTLTKISMLIDQTDCDKTVPFKLRGNCSVVEEYGSQICDVTIHERHWLKERSITYSCTDRPIDIRFSAKRKIAKSKGPTDPVILDMIQEALRNLEVQSKRNNKQIIIKVNSVSSQLVAGFLTHIEFVVGLTNCPTNIKIDEAAECQLLENEPLKTCTAKVWDRSWIEDGRQVEVSCKDPTFKSFDPVINSKSSPTGIYLNQGNKNVNVRLKREAPGSQREKDPSDPVYAQLAKESFQKYLTDTGNSQPHPEIVVDKVTVQIVAGTLTNIDFKVSPIAQDKGDVISCHSQVWEKPWLNFKEIKVSCNIGTKKSRTKRSLVGGEKIQDPSDPKYKKLADDSLEKFLQDIGNPESHTVISVNNVTTQVVAGVRTKINFSISPIAQTQTTITCNSVIWARPWLNSTEIIVSCNMDNNKSRTKRNSGLIVGEKEQDPSNPKYKQFAEKSLAKYLQNAGKTQVHKVVLVKKVTTMVFEGTRTIIDFEASALDHNTKDHLTCHSEIWERSWLELTEIIEVSCEINDEKVKKTKEALDHNLKKEGMKKKMPNRDGFYEQDPGKLEYKDLADISMLKYLEESAISQPHEVVNVDKVFTQGPRTIMSFKITPQTLTSDDVISCVSDIWHEHWGSKMEIKVNCDLDKTIANDIDYSEKRIKRHVGKLLGGEQVEDPSQEEYKELARDALKEYKKKNPGLKNHVLVNVTRVTKQIVSGAIYKIYFTIAHKSCAHDVSACGEEKVLTCYSKTKQRMWEFLNDIEVSCNTNRKISKREINLKDTEENRKLDQLTQIEILDLDERGKRQAGIDDDDLSEDTRFYYADRAIQQLNDQLKSSNLYKLITVHSMQSSIHMDNTPMVRIFFDAAETYCLRGHLDTKMSECEELDSDNHRLCLARVWPSPDDEMVIQHVSVVCDNDPKFESITGLNIASFLRTSLRKLESEPNQLHKLVHIGAPQLIPSLDSNSPMRLNFVVGTTNCSKLVDNRNMYNCFLDTTIPSTACSAYLYLTPNSRTISSMLVKCAQTQFRQRRAIPLDPVNATIDDLAIQKMVKESLEKLEMSSPERYKQKVLRINSCSSKVTSGKVTTIDFDVGFTSCLKYEWVDDINTCGVLEHLPRRHCVAEVWDRLWLDNGRKIEVSCEDEVVPLEAHVEFQSAATAMALANRALKHIEAKYPHPRKQKVMRIYSMDKQVVAGVHYRMKMEVGLTNCSALSVEDNCVFDKKAGGVNKFCRVNVWLRPWTDHPPNFRVSCDYQEGATADMFHQIQAEHLFRDFLSTYSRDYVNDLDEMLKRFDIFKTNIARIHELNTHERGTATYGVTRFADLTYEEFTNKHTGLKPSLRNENQVPMAKAQIPNVDLPETFDWREHGAVTEVKDQGSCGSCWAFSVTGNVEGQWQIKSGKLVSLSEQELVDCDKMDDGCNGGLPDNAYRAIEQLGGLELESDYPYEGENDKCSFNKSMARVQISSAVNITANETDMAKWLVEKGPISIGINANAMQFYMGGVSHPWKMLCNPKNLDHGVLIVGFGVKNYPLFHKRLPYWIVKNSWGPSWGEQGYYRVFRGDGTCGINQMASSAVI